MTATVTFFPLGNADTLRIDLADGRKMLVDYADMRNPADKTDPLCDLPSELRRDLARSRRDGFDAVCITHVDNDHCKGFGDFFWLDHANKYQGEGRARIGELWVPAAAVLEEGVDGDARLVRAEARHRLIAGYGVRVFSRPQALRDWLATKGIDLDSRRHLIVDAGKLVPGYAKESACRAEFFVHSPFGHRQDALTVIDRNQDSIVMQVTFREGGNDYHLLLGSDVNYESLSTIVQITRAKGNAHRLLWDLMKLPHHCSYTALGPERGQDETVAVPDVRWLFETQGRRRAVIVSPSWPIPAKGTTADDDIQPPHRQAANHHRRVARQLAGRFLVTMEHPTVSRPALLVFEVTSFGVGEKLVAPAVGSVASVSTPRAG